MAIGHYLASPEVKLRILESLVKDVGLGIARIDSGTMNTMSVTEGDVIAIHGRKRTVAKCSPLPSVDEKRGIIRIDGLVRHNAGAEFGETIQVEKAKAIPAEKVTLNPLQDIPDIDDRFITDVLTGHPLTKGDDVWIPFSKGILKFQVAQTSPDAQTLLITNASRFVLPRDRIVPMDVFQDRMAEEFAEQELAGKPEQIVKQFNDNRLEVNRVLRAMNNKGYFATNVTIVRQEKDAKGFVSSDYAFIFTRKDKFNPQ